MDSVHETAFVLADSFVAKTHVSDFSFSLKLPDIKELGLPAGFAAMLYSLLVKNKGQGEQK